MNTNYQNTRSKEIKILFVDSQEEHKDAFAKLIQSTNFQMVWIENSFKAIQWLKNHGDNAVALVVIDKHIKPLNSFQTYEYIKTELEFNIPVLVVHDEGDEPDYADFKGLDFIKTEYTEGSLSKINEVVLNQENISEEKPRAYSLDYLKELSDNNEAFISSSLALFLTSVSERMIDMDKAMSKKNYKKVSEIAHNIKPSFAMIESHTGEQLCDTMAHRAEENQLAEMVNKLNALFVELKEQLKTDYPAYNTL